MSGSGPLDRAANLITAAAGLITAVTGLAHLVSKRTRRHARARVHRAVHEVLRKPDGPPLGALADPVPEVVPDAASD